jgi:nitroreductase
MKFLVLLLLVFAQISVFAKEIKLPQPNRTGGMPLMEALDARRSSRDFSSEEISKQQLSDLLWATWGISSPDGRRTAPTARNRQAIDLYVIRKDGIFKYYAQENVLRLVLAGDHRKIAGTQAFAQTAPLNLLLVTDLERMGANTEQNILTANLDAGFLAQNTSLFAASEGLKCVVRMLIDRDEIRTVMGFNENMYPVLALTVGL